MNESPHSVARPRASEAGFSVVEGLIAAALLVFILIGVLPLFERSRLNLMQGNDSTQVANAVIDGTTGSTGCRSTARSRTSSPARPRPSHRLLAARREPLGGRHDALPTDRAQFTRTHHGRAVPAHRPDRQRRPGHAARRSAPTGTVHIKRITAQVVNGAHRSRRPVDHLPGHHLQGALRRDR